MEETLKNILYLVLIGATVILTILLSAVLINLLSILNNFRRVLNNLRAKYLFLENIVSAIYDKIESGAAYLGLLVETMKSLVGLGGRKKRKK